MNTVITMAQSRLYSCLAMLTFVAGGFFCVGAVVVWMFAKFEHLGFEGLITFVLIFTFVLFGLGAHCMDIEDKRDRQDRN